MILPKGSEAFERVRKESRELLPMHPFFGRYKESFQTHFIEEVKKETGITRIKERLLHSLSSKFYDAMVDFKTAAPHELVEEFLHIRNRGVLPLLLLQKLLSSMILRVVNDYSDDRDLFRYLQILSGYFDSMLDYLKTVLQADTDREFSTHVVLKRDEVDRWLADGSRIRLLNVYKGIPVVYEAVAGRSSNEKVVLQMPSERGVLAQMEGRAVCFDRRMEPFAIELKIGRMAYRGDIALAEVEDMAWIDSIAHRRKRVRVALDNPLKARITALGRQFNVDLIDISGNGVCLQTDVGFGLPLYEQVEVTLPIPQEDGSVRNIVMRGSLQYISTHDDSRRRYHIFLHASPRKEEILSAFVTRRELALLKELKSLAKKRKG